MNDQERAAFEAWGRAEGLEDKAIGRGMDYPLGEHLWRAWQAGRAALAAAPQVPAPSSGPTTHLQRFGDALALLCSGHRPSDEMMAAWLDIAQDDHRLQEFAIEHGPSWAQGIGVIDAARVLADQPEEDAGHEEAPQAPAVPLAWIPADALEQLQPPRLRLLSVPLVTYSAEGHVPIYAAPGAAQPAPQAPLTGPSPTSGMTIEQRILHVGGRNNAAGYVEFGSTQAVLALVRQVQRDFPPASHLSPIPDHEIVTLYAESPSSDAEMIEFARAIEAAHGIRAAGVKEPGHG